MGKKLRLKEEKRRAAERAVAACLEVHSRYIKYTAPDRPAVALRDFSRAQQEAIGAFRHLALRAPEDWRCGIKSRLDERRFLDLVKFTFARYPVARHFDSIWDGDPRYRLVNDDGRPVLNGERLVDPRGWYILATQGGSLYRQVTHAFMSKAETHHFLTAPSSVTSWEQALWYAVARARTEDRALALRISMARLAGQSIGSHFWRGVARFFVQHPTALAEMNDFTDFLQAMRHEDPCYSLKGRTLESLRRRMAAWHHVLRVQSSVCGGSWEGRALPDVDYHVGNEDNQAIWRFRQIKTGNALFKEGQRMHHCVASYKSGCMSGDISIWSLTSEFPIGHKNRGVTLEVRKDGAILQCRGFANRLPYSNEVTMVKRWAQEHGLEWCVIPA